jgi:hypothetical protein
VTPERSNRRKCRDEDDDRPPRKKKNGDNTLMIVLAVGGVVFVLLLCVVGGGIFTVVMLAGDTTKDARVPGSWKGRFEMRRGPVDVVYTFNKDGSFRDEEFDVRGRRQTTSTGRWRMRDGKILIDWDNGAFETASVTWTDDNTMAYRIVKHLEAAQIGLTTTFRRQ